MQQSQPSFDSIVIHPDFDAFVYDFTKRFLRKFYGETDFFNIGAIAKKSTQNIINRATYLLTIIGESYYLSNR